MLEALEVFDREIFFFFNGLHQPWLDQTMFYMTKAVFWTPVYLLLLYLIAKTYSWKIMLWSLLAIAVIITLGDRISVELFKNVFQRYRPSRNLEIGPLVHIVNDYRGGLYGFVSSHATNFFSITTFVILLLRKRYRGITPLLVLWASLICYTRVYLGVHYPSDILVGTMLGVTIGFSIYKLFKYLMLKPK